MTKLLLAEDDPLTLAGIQALLAGSDFVVVAAVASGRLALDVLPTARPDVLVLDFEMPERSGLDVLRVLRERGDKRPIVLLTGSMSDRKVYEALQLGVNGLVVKATAPQNLLTCLTSVCEGKRWIDHEVLQRVMELSLNPQADGPLDKLSKRERSVVGLVLQGLKNREIADELGIGEGTIKVHLHNIFEKMGVSSRMELAFAAAKAVE